MKRPFFLSRLDLRGMTLVEALVVVGLVLVVVAAGIAPYVTQQNFLRAQFNRNRLQDESSLAMSYITRDIFSAKAIVTAGPFPVNDQLILTVGTGPLRTDEQTITYNRVGASNTITRTVDAGTAQTIASHISALQFDRTGAENFYLTVNITAQIVGPTAVQTQTIIMESGAALRAIRPS